MSLKNSRLDTDALDMIKFEAAGMFYIRLSLHSHDTRLRPSLFVSGIIVSSFGLMEISLQVSTTLGEIVRNIDPSGPGSHTRGWCDNLTDLLLVFIVQLRPEVRVILSAQILELTNFEVATPWLKLSRTDKEAVVLSTAKMRFALLIVRAAFICCVCLRLEADWSVVLCFSTRVTRSESILGSLPVIA